MYESFYGFTEKPFSISPDPKYLYLSRSHRDALNHMRYGIAQGEGFMVVAGEVGLGKTTLSRTLLEQLPKTVPTALIFNPLVTEKELLEQILEEFGVLPKGVGSAAEKSTKDYYDLLNGFLLKAAPTGGAVLLIDEAQNLSLSLLEAIRLLSNFETDKGKLLQILLLGQVELLEKLKRPELVQLTQRITIKYRLRALQAQELAGYIAHRTQVAGAKAPIIFEPGALKAVYQFSRGVPRLINLACDRALLAGFEEGATTISVRMVARGIESLENTDAYEPQWRGMARRQTLNPHVVLFSLLALIILVLLLWSGRGLLAEFVRKQVAKNPEPESAGAQTVGVAAVPEMKTETRTYIIALESHTDQVPAQQRVEQLKSLGYGSYLGKVAQADGSAFYVVYLSGFQTEEAMHVALAQLQAVGSFPNAQLIITE